MDNIGFDLVWSNDFGKIVQLLDAGGGTRLSTFYPACNGVIETERNLQSVDLSFSEDTVQLHADCLCCVYVSCLRFILYTIFVMSVSSRTVYCVL